MRYANICICSYLYLTLLPNFGIVIIYVTMVTVLILTCNCTHGHRLRKSSGWDQCDRKCKEKVHNKLHFPAANRIKSTPPMRDSHTFMLRLVGFFQTFKLMSNKCQPSTWNISIWKDRHNQCEKTANQTVCYQFKKCNKEAKKVKEWKKRAKLSELSKWTCLNPSSKVSIL